LTTRTVLLVIYLQDNCKLKHTGCTRNDSSMKRDGGQCRSRPLHACIFFASGFTVAVQYTGERRNRAVRIRSGCICRGAGCVGLSAEQFAFLPVSSTAGLPFSGLRRAVICSGPEVLPIFLQSMPPPSHLFTSGPLEIHVIC
jgi:hypothetical protein